MDNDDPRFPSSRFLRVPFIFVPKGSPPPLEWMREHPDHFTVSGYYTPPPPPEPNMGLEPQPGAEGQAEPSPETPIYLVDLDASGRWAIARPVEPLTPRTAPHGTSEADRLFEARCQAAWEAAQSPEVQAQTDQRTVLVDAAMVSQASATAPMSRRRKPDPPPPTPPPWPPGISKPEADRLFAVGYRAGREATQSPTFHARTDQLIEVVGAAVIAQARADGIRAAVAGAVALDPVVDAAILAALAALGVVAAAEAEPSHPYAPARSFPGFEPPRPSPPLPGLVPPPLPQRRPDEGGFTPAPPTPPLPGFTPLPPSVPVHPGRPAEANKPTIVSHDTSHHKPSPAKGPLPPPKAAAKGVRRYNPKVPAHRLAAAAEKRLAHEVHGTPDEQVVEWGGPIGSHGADVISVDIRTGAVTLWDAKYRSKRVRIGASSTFKANTPARANAIKQAEEAIEKDKSLSPQIRKKAEANLLAGRIRTVTTGFGKAINSVIGN